MFVLCKALVALPREFRTQIASCLYRYSVSEGYCRVSLQSCGPDSSVGIGTELRLDGPGSNPGGGEIFRTCLDRPWSPPSLLYNKYRVFPGGKERPGLDAEPSRLIVPWSKKSKAIPLHPLWAVRPVQSLRAS